MVGAAGTRIAVEDADEHVFGLCLLNDWSARDIQAFEMAPLGPFLGKSFATSVSPWITPLAALEPPGAPPGQAAAARVPRRRRPRARPRVGGADQRPVVSRPPFAEMYWTYAQMLAHLTSNGASVRAGDVFASGTVSGPDATSAAACSS